MPYRYQPPQRKKLSLSHLPYLLRHPYRLGRATSPPLPPLLMIMPWTNPSITNRSLSPLILLNQCNLTSPPLPPLPMIMPWTNPSITNRSLPPLILLNQCNLTTVCLVTVQLHPFLPTTPWTKQSISL